MLQQEFEDLTGTYPDRILYDVIEREYERQDENGHDVWDDKAQFCHAYKFNEDGLAERIQAAANEAIWQMEERHRKALNERLKGRTRIVITQRVVSAMHSDRIFVLSDGQLVGCGTHAELLERCSIYREIYLSQTGGGVLCN